jgi:hypothetical protein
VDLGEENSACCLWLYTFNCKQAKRDLLFRCTGPNNSLALQFIDCVLFFQIPVYIVRTSPTKHTATCLCYTYKT